MVIYPFQTAEQKAKERKWRLCPGEPGAAVNAELHDCANSKEWRGRIVDGVQRKVRWCDARQLCCNRYAVHRALITKKFSEDRKKRMFAGRNDDDF